MTIKDIFAHLINWRWQLFCWAACLTFGLVFDATFGHGLFASFRAYLIDAELGGLIGLVNVAWTLIKACIAFPGLWTAIWFSVWLDS